MLASRKESILWLAVLLAASFLRFAPIAASLPYIDYIDEGYALHQAIDLLNRRTLDTGWYGYPSLPPYLTAGSLVLLGPIYRHFHGHNFRNDLPPDTGRPPTAGHDYDLISPPELILAGRFVTATLSVATVLLAGIIARKLQGRLAGFLALLLAAACPALVLRGSNVIIDTFATFFVLLTLYFCEQFRGNKGRAAAFVAAAGFAAGLAFASKYTAGAVFVAVLAGIWILPERNRMRLRLTLLATAGLLAAIVAGAPATILHWPSLVRDLAGMAGHYRILDSTPGYFGQAVANLELGWLVVLAGCVGLVLMFRQTSTRWTVVSWSLFAAILLAPLVGKTFQPFRNVLPLVPPLCIAAAIAFASFINWTRREAPSPLGRGAAIVFATAAVVSSALACVGPVQHRMTHRDTRLQAIDWLQQHAASGECVLGVSELAILPAEWKRLTANTTVVPWCEALDLLDRNQFDYVVTGEFDTRNAPEPVAASTCLARWKEKNAALPATVEFGSGPTFVVPYLWHTNDERIVIRRTKGAKLP